MSDPNVTVVETGVVVEAGPLRYVVVEHVHIDWEGNVTIDLPEPFAASVKDMEFDGTGCDVCDDAIGHGLGMDPETTVDYAVFHEFTLVQVGDGPVVRLCEDCDGVRHVLVTGRAT